MMQMLEAVSKQRGATPCAAILKSVWLAPPLHWCPVTVSTLCFNAWSFAVLVLAHSSSGPWMLSYRTNRRWSFCGCSRGWARARLTGASAWSIPCCIRQYVSALPVSAGVKREQRSGLLTVRCCDCVGRLREGRVLARESEQRIAAESSTGRVNGTKQWGTSTRGHQLRALVAVAWVLDIPMTGEGETRSDFTLTKSTPLVLLVLCCR
ncbi:hypothetical protein GY45DRAFT_775174 [Cubamyces sp. BRFM 1775]|nr:hypothetical protein GY45DRAFT_775174 [Cubamyces sp. BRFM 1775]